MNVPVLIVACLSLVAVIAHIFSGTKDSASIAPDKDSIRLEKNWKQSMCAFQML